MISKLAVFHRGGAVLWRSDEDDNVTSPQSNADDQTSSSMATSEDTSLASYLAINKLIQTILLSDKTASDAMVYDSFTLKWTFANNLNLVFVAVYFSFQKLLYVDDFLDTVKAKFIEMFHDSLNGGIDNLSQQNYSHFYAQFKRIQKYYKTTYRSAPKKWKDTKKGSEQNLYKHNNTNKKSGAKNGDNSDNDDDDDDASSPTINFGRKRGTKSKKPAPFRSKSSKNVGKNGKNKKKKNKKNGKLKKEHWSANNVLAFNKKKVSKRDMDALNVALEEVDENEAEEEEEVILAPVGKANLDDSSDESSDFDDDDFSDLSIRNRTKKDSNKGSNGVWNRFSKLIGNKPLEESDVISVLKDFENLLSSKNVANVIATEICSSLKAQLIGKQIGTFNTIRSVVKSAMTECMERILTPTRPINILHGIKTAQEENRPYSIVFIGVNGVGKSTSLSKVINYLKQRNLKVSVAACDTFRSGAVEQLKTHCRALNVRLFQQGYARDAASVAYRAIDEATKQKDDVVLVDTAGRMQNNAPLMKSLVSLIQRNKPDLTLFVGEALVGNDGVDQLMEFNKALAMNGNTHLIDGIILTKFDTVDDKVGAAISMTYKSRKPIVFIGTGQDYKDLQRMKVKTLINKLLQ